MTNPNNKRRKMTTASLFDRLDDDCLRAVLIRCDLSDVPNLHRTCTRFHRAIETSVYRRDRALLNHAIVTSVTLVDPFEQYKEDKYGDADDDDGEEVKGCSRDDASFVNNYDEFGYKSEYDGLYHCAQFQVRVDHKIVEEKTITIDAYLIPRDRQYGHGRFFELCDSIDGALQELSVACFDNNGKPRLKSMKDSIPKLDKRPLLYISEFELPEEYRNSCSIGPTIIQTLLTETFKDRWSVAMYIPHHKPQYNQNDTRRWYNDEIQGSNLSSAKWGSDEQIRMKKEWSDRKNLLTKQDMTQFFRAGFQQLCDASAIRGRKFFMTYAIADDINKHSASSSILTVKESMDIKIIDLPSSSSSSTNNASSSMDYVRTAKEMELFEFMRSKSSGRQELVRAIDECKRPMREQPDVKSLLDLCEKTIADLDKRQEEAVNTKRMAEENILELENLTNLHKGLNREQLETLREQDREHFMKIEAMKSAHVDHIKESESTIAKFKQMRIKCRTDIDAELKIMEEGWGKTQTINKLKREKELNEFDLSVREHVVSMITEEQEENDQDYNTKHKIKSIIMKSNAVHACTFYMCRPYVQLLLDLLPSKDDRFDALNSSFDEHGSTPLMVLASTPSSSMIDPDRLDFYNYLIADCGADTNVTNKKDGLTAFGKFRETQRSAQDFELTFNLGGSAFGSSSSNNNDSKTIATALERMLMPTNGLSEADQTLKEEFDNTDTDDEDDDDEFDMDDDEFDDDDENV